MLPNIYAYVTFLQPHLQAKNDLPIRIYGVIPIAVEDPETRLKPYVETPEKFTPETTAKITVGESSGRPMTYTVAVVDEGLLDLTRFRTPNPWDFFFRREALGVKTWDLFDMVAGAYGGVLEQLLAIGGDSDGGGEPKNKKANRFPPMVRFLGPFELQSGEKNMHFVDIPQYIGSVRVMVVAGQGNAYGVCEKAVFVKKPLMILGTLPRVIGPYETVDMPVSVFAMEENVKNVSVKVNVEGPVSLDGDAAKSISFSQPGDELVVFRLKAGVETGIAKVTINASGGGIEAVHTMEFDVRMPGGPVTDVADSIIEKDTIYSEKVKFPGMAGTNKVILEVSRIPALNLEKRLGYLIRYPHGCVEQTTSSVFPQLYLDQLMELTRDKKIRIETNIKAGIKRLKRFQILSGGFAYWPGADHANEWASNYAGHFLVEAKRAGYIVPAHIITQWKKYQKTSAVKWEKKGSRSDLTQAYRLYTLALSGSPELGAMNRLCEMKNLSTTARWRLATAYYLAGQPEAAEDLIDNHNTNVSSYTEMSNTFGSHFRDKAMILEALSIMNNLKEAVPLIKEIATELGSDRWLSTQTTSYMLIALARHAGVTNASGNRKNMSFSFIWNDSDEQQMSSYYPVIQQELDAQGLTQGELTIHNSGDLVLYSRIIMEGVPKPGNEKDAENGMRITIDYQTTDGTYLNPVNLEPGTDFIALVTVKNIGKRGTYKEIALSQIFPSGWEIYNIRMGAGRGTETVKKKSAGMFKYQDIRDDRIYTYFDLKQGQEKTFKTILTAAYTGDFYLPMVMAEAMYDATINGRIAGQWITVKYSGAD